MKQLQYKGALCCTENVCYPSHVSYKGMDVPVVTSPESEGGDYLLFTLDTNGTPMSFFHTVVNPTVSKPILPLTDRLEEPTCQFIYQNGSGVVKVPGWIDPSSVRLVGIRLRDAEQHVSFIPLVDSASNVVRPDTLRPEILRLRIRHGLISQNGNRFSFNVSIIVNTHERTMAGSALPPNVVGLVFGCNVYTSHDSKPQTTPETEQ